MGLNAQTSAERVHIGFFGLRNAGKSSLVNAVTGQKLSLVSEIKGTTTDPVKKAMEILPLGPVVIIDTPGIDDEGDLGEMRVERALQVLNQVDIAVLIVDAAQGLKAADKKLIAMFREKDIEYIIAYNKSDLLSVIPEAKEHEIYVSALLQKNINELREFIGKCMKAQENNKHLIADLLSPNDQVVLVVPIDESAPKGRLILPQQHTIREILDAGAVAVVTREKELEQTLKRMSVKPRMVITDSQAFGFVNKIVAEDDLLTSFSILFSRYKGYLEEAVRGADQISLLQDGDTVLISEGCTHHRQCNDIGTVKLPGWIKNFTGKEIKFEFSSGGEFPKDLSKYALVIHCGGCMLNEREVRSRIRHCADQKVPVTNYGIAIAHMNGILKRSLEPFSIK